MTTSLSVPPIQLGDLVFNVEDDNGVLIGCNIDDGWLGGTKPTIASIQRPSDHGSWSGVSFLSNRPIALSGVIIAPTQALLEAAITSLNAAHTLDETQFAVTFGGLVKYATVRTAAEPMINLDNDTCASWSSQLVADDPRKYSIVTAPVVAVNATATIVNAGDIESPLYFEVTGPCTGPTITVTDSDGVAQSFTMFGTYSLATGATVDISSADHSVFQGTVSKAQYVLTRGWPVLAPGSNTVQFATVTGTLATLKVYWRSAWR